jgi:hypothetical protein
MDLEEKLWRRRIVRASEWSEVARYLVDRLGEYLGQPIVVDEITPVDESSFTCSIHGDGSPARPLQVAWRGVLGMEPIQGESLVTATVIPFLLGERLRVGDHSSSTIELVFERLPDGIGRWKCEGWQKDDYGEWEGVMPL